MESTLSTLEDLMLHATDESFTCPNPSSLEGFAAVMRCCPDGPQLAAQLLAARIHTPNTQSALLALALTNRCLEKCGRVFQAEIGKFRFLNEMIKLVSPKYLAHRTAPEVKAMVLKLLHSWCAEYSHEFKFRVAYDMLKNQGVLKETPPPLPPEGEIIVARTKHAIFEDEEKSKLLQKLLQSKKPEDIQHANRLIKSMVREEERRTEASSRRAQEISTALDSASLLLDMLNNAENASPDEVSLIHELHAIIAKMRVVMDEMGPSVAGEEDNPGEISDARTILDNVHEKYEAFCDARKRNSQNPKNESLLDFAGSSSANESAGKGQEPKNALDELGDIFAMDGAENNAELLQPVNFLSKEDVALIGAKPKTEGWNTLDSLSEQLLKQSLPKNAKRGGRFKNKSKKTPMNALTSPQHDVSQSAESLFNLDFFFEKHSQPQAPTEHNQPTTNDEVIVDFGEGNTNILDIDLPDSNSDGKYKGKNDPKTLTDVKVTIDDLQPSNVPPLTVYEEKDGLTVVLHFCKDKPKPDVYVVVITTTNRSKYPIEDYKMQIVLPKGIKFRLLPASRTSLPACNPFLPPPALTQVMLISRPTPTPIDLKYVMTYTLDDDGCSEMGEVKQLPFDDIQ